MVVPQGHIVGRPGGGPRAARRHHHTLRLQPLCLHGVDGGVPEQAAPEEHPLRVGVGHHLRLRLEQQALPALGAEGGPRQLLLLGGQRSFFQIIFSKPSPKLFFSFH